MTNPWTDGDGPLPDNVRDLVAEIKVLAAARQRDAMYHPADHDCDGCKVRRIDRNRQQVRKKLAS